MVAMTKPVAKCRTLTEAETEAFFAESNAISSGRKPRRTARPHMLAPIPRAIAYLALIAIAALVGGFVATAFLANSTQHAKPMICGFEGGC